MRKRGIDFNLEEFGTAFRIPDSQIATRLLGPLHRGPALELLRDIGLHLLSQWRSRIPEIISANEILVELILEYYHARLFVDKGNLALRLKYLLRIPSFEVKVVHLIRDGRSVALTYMDPHSFADTKDPTMRGGGSGVWREERRFSMASAARQWRRCNEEAEHILHRLDKSQWIEVCYEELCEDTEKTLGRVFWFLGVDPDKRARDFRMVEHHVVGNGMRLDKTSEIRLDERWRVKLTEEELRVFDRIAGELNRRYGYE